MSIRVNRFPTTRPSAVQWVQSTDRATRLRGVRAIAEVYWSPIYKHLRLRMPREHAEDAVQAFFLRLVEGNLLAAYDPSRARFRTYLRRCLDNLAIDAHRSNARRERVGELAFDFDRVEASIDGTALDAAIFDREWVRRVADVAVERLLARLAKRGHAMHAELFRRFHLQDDPPTYQAVADELGVTLTDVTNWLHIARREFRTVALALLREITANDEEFVAEAREVFGIAIRR
jgi:RNA polymerase sigma factor (sigma-70 family)